MRKVEIKLYKGKTCFGVAIEYLLRDSVILDSGTTDHIFNDRKRFVNFKEATCGDYVTAGNSQVAIIGYGTVNFKLTNGENLILKECAYCPDMATSLVSLAKLKGLGIGWWSLSLWLYRNNKPITYLQEKCGQFVLEFRPIRTAFPAQRSRVPRPRADADGWLWHHRLGHAQAAALEHLDATKDGYLQGPAKFECAACSVAKPKRKISRRPPSRPAYYPSEEMAIDFHPMDDSNSKFVRHVLLTDRFSGSVRTFALPNERSITTLNCLKDAYAHDLTQYGVRWRKIRSDLEISKSHDLRDWMLRFGIKHEPSAAYTQAQDGLAERIGGVIGAMARSMRLHANLPTTLWPEVIEAACYLYNRTPNAKNN